MTSPTAAPRLNLIGPGRLGQHLARALAQQGEVSIGQIVGRDPQRTAAARDWIGDGEIAALEALAPAPLTLLAVPDDALPGLAATLAQQGYGRPGDIVFHCSGALPAAILAPLTARGVRIASVHPLKSFTVPTASRPADDSLAGIWCGCEGDEAALTPLIRHVERLGAHCFAIDPTAKTLYHAAAVLACNTLVALMDAALRSMEAAGVPRAAAWPALQPLIAGTLENIGRRGAPDALTGPVARGDAGTVARQLQALDAALPDVATLYRPLSAACAALAAPRLTPEQQAALANLLQAPQAGP